MNSLNFCADGTLYFQNGPEEPLISATTVFRFSKKDFPGKDLGLDFTFWAEHLNKDVYFEEGLTIKTFFECLMPWCDYFSHQAQVNLREYYNEMKEPVKEDNPFYQHSDYIMLYSNVSFSPARLEDMYVDKNVHIDDAHKYEFNSKYFLSGFKMGEYMPVDISMVPMQYIANTPLFLMYNRTIEFGDYLKKTDSIYKDTIKFPKNSYGVQKTTDNTAFFETMLQGLSLEEMLRSFFCYIFRDINRRDKGNRIKIELKPKNDKSATLLSFPNINKEKDIHVSSNNELSDNVIEVPFKKIADEKKFSSIVGETLVSSLMENRVMNDMLIAYEKRINLKHRIFENDIELGFPPEPRKGYIGLITEEDIQ